MGRPPKPTALKLIAGNPGRRKLPVNEPMPDALDDIEPPAHLSVAAADVWRELAPQLRAANVLTELDTLALELLCVAVAQYRQATSSMGDELLSTNPETGAESMSRWLIVQSMAFKQAKALADGFGMTPAARTRVMTAPKDDKPALDGAKRFFG